MVLLHVKRQEESQFLYSCKVTDKVESVLRDLVNIYNGRRKVLRLVDEVNDLAKHGVVIKPELQGLNKDQVKELKLVDEYEEQCEPSGGFAYDPDPVQRRNGRAPIKGMKKVLIDSAEEAKKKVHKDNVQNNVEVSQKTVKESLDLIDGACKIVWPMGLPPFDPVRMELENCEDLSGTQESKKVLDPQKAVIWFATKEMKCDKHLKDYVGSNEKTKVVVKLSTLGAGPPVREPLLSENERKHLMLAEHRRREEVKRLMEDSEYTYMNQDWASNKQLAQSLQGVKEVSWKPR